MDHILDYEKEENSSLRAETNKKIFLISFFILGFLNTSFFTWLIPYAQKNMNNHSGNEALVVILISSCIVALGIGLIKLSQKRKVALIFFAYIINLIYWMNKLAELSCTNCMIN